MKKLNKLFTVLTSIFLIAAFVSCNSQFNEDVMFNTVGRSLDKTPPAEVVLNSDNLITTDSITLSWTNPCDKDLYGIKITKSSNANNSTPEELFFINSDSSLIPTTHTFKGLSNLETIKYQFLIQTIDKNMNLSSGIAFTQQCSRSTSYQAIRVDNLIAEPGNGSVKLTWTNKTSGYNTSTGETETINQIGVKILVLQNNTIINSLVTVNEDASSSEIPSEYLVTNLTNGERYTFDVYELNSDYSPSASRSTSATVGDTNTMEVQNVTTTASDGTIFVEWENPSSPDFYGLQIYIEPQTNPSASYGNLTQPVYFLSNTPSDIPTSFSIYDLSNNENYKVIIKTRNKKFTTSTGSTAFAMPQPTSNTTEVENLNALCGNGYVTLYWELDSNSAKNLDHYYVVVSPTLSYELPNIPIKDRNFKITGLTNDNPYSFTIRTVDKNKNESIGVDISATPSTGASSIRNNSDLIDYKYDKRAFDFGYRKTPYTKEFSFVASGNMDLSKTIIAYPDTNTKFNNSPFSFTIGSKKEGNVGGQTVENTDPFKLTITYTPSTYNPNDASTAKWDEADIVVGGDTSCTIRLLASNFPQPKDIVKPNYNGQSLQIWLRADMINKQKHLDGSQDKVKILPDYSGNGYDAKCTDPKCEKAPTYVSSSANFNNNPTITFEQIKEGNLVSTGIAGNPILQSTDGITAFVVYKLKTQLADQTIISTNNGTSFPTLRNLSRYYCQSGAPQSTDYKYGLAVRGNGMKDSWRWACLTNDNDDDNRMMVTAKHSNTQLETANEYVGGKTLSTCMIFDRTIQIDDVEDTGNKYEDGTDINNYHSNIRMYINNKERLLGYIYTINDSRYRTTESLHPENSNSVVGSYGRPIGDTKGHRFGSVSQLAVPSAYNSNEDSQYQKWFTEINKELSGNVNRKYDRSYSYTPMDRNSATKSTGDTYLVNWISTDLWRNGTINTLTVGADYVNSSNCYAEIAEVFIFDYALTNEQIDQMNNYITYRYGIETISDNIEDYRKQNGN